MIYLDLAKQQVELDEGRRSKPYVDTVGKVTIGVGRNLTDKGLSQDEIDFLFSNDLHDAELDARALFPTFDSLSDVRKAALINMSLNLGRDRLSGFHHFRQAINNEDWSEAKTQMLNSLWAHQVGQRAIRLAEQIERG